jgi:hypothetical protein
MRARGYPDPRRARPISTRRDDLRLGGGRLGLWHWLLLHNLIPMNLPASCGVLAFVDNEGMLTTARPLAFWNAARACFVSGPMTPSSEAKGWDDAKKEPPPEAPVFHLQGTESSQTRRWRKADSNSRSHLRGQWQNRKRPLCAGCLACWERRGRGPWTCSRVSRSPRQPLP